VWKSEHSFNSLVLSTKDDDLMRWCKRLGLNYNCISSYDLFIIDAMRSLNNE
jgi:hypothetical protein